MCFPALVGFETLAPTVCVCLCMCVCVYVFVCLFQAKGKERQWLKNQALGELDDAKIIDGLTGEKAIYKRRGELDPEVCVCGCVFL